MAILLKVIYRFKKISIKMPMTFSPENKSIQKVIQNTNDPRQPTILSKKKTYDKQQR